MFYTDAELALMSTEERNAILDHWVDDVADAVYVSGVQDLIEEEYMNVRPSEDSDHD